MDTLYEVSVAVFYAHNKLATFCPYNVVKYFFIVSIRKWCFYGVFGIHVFWDFNWIKSKTFWLYVHQFYKGVHNTVKTSCWHFEICIFCNFSFIDDGIYIKTSRHLRYKSKDWEFGLRRNNALFTVKSRLF